MEKFDAEKETVIQRICGQLVEREVIYNVSSLISRILEIDESAIDEIPCSVEDWTSPLEEYETDDKDEQAELDRWESGEYTAQEACEALNLKPYESEIYEYWLISEYLAEKLREHGEAVFEYYGLTVWGRTTTGQAILLDGVIRKIAREMEILPGQRYDWSK